MAFRFQDFVDVPSLQVLADNFTRLTKIPTALLEYNGEILVRSGWQRICTEFHRKNHETSLRCKESDIVLGGRIPPGKKYNIYKCKNGLIDAAVPIVISNIHVSTLFAGQFFFKKPEKKFFKEQAEAFGFDKQTYLEALSEVPIFTEEHIENAMIFLINFAELLGEMGLKQKKLTDISCKMEYLVEQRTEELKKALDEVKTLKGILPICSHCKKIRSDDGSWEEVDVYIRDHSNADLSHSLCPECVKKYYPEAFNSLLK